MSNSYKFANFDTFQPVENMNQTVRNKQYAYNGRMFIPPTTDAFSMDADIGKNSLNPEYQSRYEQQGLIPSLESSEIIKPYELYKNSEFLNKIQV